MSIQDVVTYRYLREHQIHEYIFAEASRKAMDAYMSYIYDMYEDRLKGKTGIRIILDIHESGMLPVRYAAAIMEKMFKDLAPFPKPYVAYLSGGSVDRSLISSMDYTASKHVDRLDFPFEAREEAIAWLLTRAVD